MLVMHGKCHCECGQAQLLRWFVLPTCLCGRGKVLGVAAA